MDVCMIVFVIVIEVLIVFSVIECIIKDKGE